MCCSRREVANGLRIVGLLATMIALTSHYAAAQMTPLDDGRDLDVTATSGAATDHQERHPPTPYAFWNEFLHVYVEGGENEHSEAEAFQVSQFFPSAIYTAGGVWGEIQGPGEYDASSDVVFQFRLDQCAEFSIDATVVSNDVPYGALIDIKSLRLNAYPHYVTLRALRDSTLTQTFRLSPGIYQVWCSSWFDDESAPHTDGSTYEMMLLCSTVTNPLISVQPVNTSTPAGGTATFSVTPAPPQRPASSQSSAPRETITFQWRKNLEPLSDDGRITGTTTNMLSIHQAAYADTGYYDVVLTDGTIVEPSSLVSLTIGESEGVDSTPVGPATGLRLAEAAPNPFRTSTSLRYETTAAMPVRLAIYDAVGRMVRPLSTRVLAGPGTVTWDGRTESGAPAPAGVYFLRLVADQQEQVRRITLVR